MADDERAHADGEVAARPWWARAALLASLTALGWLLMQALHEAGHVLHAAVTGATVERVELHPFRLSRTILGVNPHPRLVAWGGPVWGCVLPLLLVLAAGRPGAERVALARALAGGCLLANGVYLGTGPFTHAGDAGDLLLSGASRATLIAFGLAATIGGLRLWSGIGDRLASAARGPVVGGLVAASGAIAVVELATAM